jgi:hypothetical protein
MLRYSFGNINGKAYGLNANELSVYEAIGKCSRKDDARGWYADMQTLANQLPHRVNRSTVSRAVDKLLTLGLIRRDGKSLFAVQIAREDVQNANGNVQNAHVNVQNAQNPAPPLYPPINNNMNEKEREQQRALCARDCEEQQDCQFEKFWKYFDPAPEFMNRRAATQMIFESGSDAAQKALVEAAQEGGGHHPGDQQNPYFYVQDFPEPQPVWKTGGEKDEDLVQVLYNGTYKICSRDTMELFGLQWVRDW